MSDLIEFRQMQIATALANGVDPDRRLHLETEFQRLEVAKSQPEVTTNKQFGMSPIIAQARYMMGTDNSDVDLVTLIGRDTPLKKHGTNEFHGPCPFCGGDDRFVVWIKSSDGKPAFWCRKCAVKGDAIDYAMLKYNLDFKGAISWLGLPRHYISSRPQETIVTDDEPPCHSWQQKVGELLEKAQSTLWSHAGYNVLDWLHTKRGFTDETIRQAKLGYISADLEQNCLDWGIQGDRFVIPRGIVIPCFADGVFWYVKVRRLVPSTEPNKYLQVKGGKCLSLYPAWYMQGKDNVFVTEGEFDALLLQQHAGDRIDVLTLGSASNRLSPFWMPRLASGKAFWIATDNDDAGHKAANYWMELVAPRGKRLSLPVKDITDYWKQGGDVRQWAISALA